MYSSFFSDEDDKGKDEPKAKQVKLAQKARKPQAAKNGPKKAHPCDKCEASFVYPFQEEEDEIIIQHIKYQNGKEPDLNYLKAKLNRKRIFIFVRIADLKAPNYL